MFFLLVLQTVATMDHIRLIWSTLAIASFVALVVVLGCWLWCKYYKQQQVPPGPMNWPLLGAVPELWSNWDRLHDWFLDYFRHTRSFRVPFQLNFTGVFTVDPACVEQLLKSKCYNYPKGPTNTTTFQELFGHGIFNVDGDEWKQQRRVASFEFASSVLRNFSTDVFRECALKLIFHVAHNAQSSSTFDLQDLCMRMTLETTCRIGFGVELGCLSASLPDIPFARCFDDANYISFYRFTDPFWKLKQFMCVGKERELKNCMQVLDNFTYKVIQTRRTEMASAELFRRTKMVRQDLLSRFTHLSTMGEEKLTDKTLRDIILNFIIAGRDTSAVTLTWFFYMMSCHPEVADKVFEEVCSIEQSNSGAQDLVEEAQFEAFAKLLTFETLGKMAYLQAALSETLRLFPAVPLQASNSR